MSSPKKAHPWERLKVLRKRLGKTQEEMAGLLHLSTKGYQRYERGERDIPLPTVDRAREHIGLNPRWLLDDEGEMFLSLAPGPEADRLRRSLGLQTEDTEADRLQRARERVAAVLEDYPAIKSNSSVEIALRNVALVDGIGHEHLHLLANAFNVVAASAKR